MDTRFTGPLDRDNTRNPTVLLYSSLATFEDVRSGAVAADVDLTPFATSIRQSPSELSFSLAWHLELYGANQPQPGDLVCAKLDDVPVFVGIVEGVNDYRNSSGTRTMSVTCRSRDATAAWREAPRVTSNYPQGTRLDIIARDIATSLGLAAGEVLLPNVSVATPHSSTQLANIPAWQMLETLMLPCGLSPMVDVLGRLTAYSRDVSRQSDIAVSVDRIIAITGSRSRPPVTRVQVKWLDPALTRVEQQDRALGGANITAGFFQREQRQEIWFSADRTQRARDTRMVIVQSSNSGLLDVADEEYSPNGLVGGAGDLGGVITLTTKKWVPLLVVGNFVAAALAANIGDRETSSTTVTIGRRLEAIYRMVIYLTLASIGTGVYEVWGTPYDFVHGRNTTEAYSKNSLRWEDKLDVVETDFIANEEHAQSVGARELIYKARGGASYNLDMVDDLRIQRGDILALPDASRIYVTDYQRDLTFGTAAVLNVQGFRV